MRTESYETNPRMDPAGLARRRPNTPFVKNPAPRTVFIQAGPPTPYKQVYLSMLSLEHVKYFALLHFSFFFFGIFRFVYLCMYVWLFGWLLVCLIVSLLLFGCWFACLCVRVVDCLTCFCFGFRACVGVELILVCVSLYLFILVLC